MQFQQPSLRVREQRQQSRDMDIESQNTWEKTYSLNLDLTSFWLGIFPITTVTFLEVKKLILHDNSSMGPGLVVVHNTRLNSYFPSLISI